MEELEELINDLLWYLFSRIPYEKEYVVLGKRCKINLDYANTDQTEEDGVHRNGDGTVYQLHLNEEYIANILMSWGALLVTGAWFRDRYDIIIRSIFKSLDVELVKFGNVWLAYPNEESGMGYPLGDYTPKEILKKEEQARVERDKERANLELQVRKARYAMRGYSSIGNHPMHTTDWYVPPTPVQPTPGTTPSNPILAQAQQRGMTQRQIEQLTQRGRTR